MIARSYPEELRDERAEIMIKIPSITIYVPLASAGSSAVVDEPCTFLVEITEFNYPNCFPNIIIAGHQNAGHLE